jgi:hypothetical protein
MSTSDSSLATDETLRPDELRKAILHLSAAIYHIQSSLDDVWPKVRGYRRAGELLPGEEDLSLSKEDLAKALKILVKDPEDGQG